MGGSTGSGRVAFQFGCIVKSFQLAALAQLIPFERVAGLLGQHFLEEERLRPANLAPGLDNLLQLGQRQGRRPLAQRQE